MLRLIKIKIFVLAMFALIPSSQAENSLQFYGDGFKFDLPAGWKPSALGKYVAKPRTQIKSFINLVKVNRISTDSARAIILIFSDPTSIVDVNSLQDEKYCTTEFPKIAIEGLSNYKIESAKLVKLSTTKTCLAIINEPNVRMSISVLLAKDQKPWVLALRSDPKDLAASQDFSKILASWNSLTRENEGSIKESPSILKNLSLLSLDFCRLESECIKADLEECDKVMGPKIQSCAKQIEPSLKFPSRSWVAKFYSCTYGEMARSFEAKKTLVSSPMCNGYLKADLPAKVNLFLDLMTSETEVADLFDDIKVAEKNYFNRFGIYTSELGRLNLTGLKYLNYYSFGFVEGDEKKSIVLRNEMKFEQFMKLAKVYCDDCKANSAKFKIIAVRSFGEPDLLDAWTLDSNGNSSHVIDGFKDVIKKQNIPPLEMLRIFP